MSQEPTQPYPSYPAPPQPPKKRRRWPWIVGIILGIIVLSSIIGGIASGGNSSTPDVGTTATAQPTQDVQPTTKQQVVTWYGTYGSILQTLTSDLNSISTDGKNEDMVSMNTDCTQLQTDVATAQGFPAIPDAQAASDYSSALTYMASAAQDCVVGTTGSGDASLLQRAASEMNQATTKLTDATADIQALVN